MRTMILVAVFSAVSIGSAGPTPQPQAQTSVVAAEDARLAAMERSDIATVETFIHPDFSVTSAQGQVSDRAAYLQRLRSASAPRPHLLHDEVQVRVYGTTAIITGRSRSIVDGKEQPQAVRYTHVYVKDGTNWKMVAMHVSPIR